jgi:serpin B
MDQLENLKKIVDENLNDMDLSDNAKRELRRKAAEKKPQNRTSRVWKVALAPVLAIFIVCALLFTNVLIPSVKVNASENLMNGVTAQSQQAQADLNSDFVAATADFSVKLFQNTVAQNQNSLISPASVYLELGMTANGADKNTKAQFESLLGGGKLTVNKLNDNYYTLTQRLQSIQNGKMKIANSIWYRKDEKLKIQQSFLQTNANFFGTGAIQLDFTKPSTAAKINDWVKSNTDGKIDKMVDKIEPNTMMYLINALFFEADWQTPYKASDTWQEAFHAQGGDIQTNFIHSSEVYLHDQTARGILKSYKDNRFSFVAILPNEGTQLKDYVKSMTGKSFLSFLKSQERGRVETFMPKFKYDFAVGLNAPLKMLGLTEGFNPEKADFTKMGTSSDGKLYISDVLHKTFIQVDELGTKAGAATKTEMATSAAAPTSSAVNKPVILNRPFVFAIIDNESSLPIFLGAIEKP